MKCVIENIVRITSIKKIVEFQDYLVRPYLVIRILFNKEKFHNFKIIIQKIYHFSL